MWLRASSRLWQHHQIQLLSKEIFALQLAHHVSHTPSPVRQALTTLKRFASTSASSSETLKNNQGFRATLSNWKQLSKFRLSLLVASTASAGYVLGSDDRIHWGGLAFTSLGTFLTAAAANTCNQVYEIANDARMKRTSNRPLPQGRVTPRYALVFALGTGSAGTALLYYTVGVFDVVGLQNTCTNNPPYLQHITGQPTDCGVGCGQHCALCRHLHPPQTSQPCQHLRWCPRGRSSTINGMGSSGGDAQPGRHGPGSRVVFLAVAAFHGIGVAVSGRLCAWWLPHALCH